MELEFKPNFEDARQRWAAFWKEEKFDRPPVSIVLPKPGVEPVEKPPYLAGADGDFEPVIDQLLAWAETHEFIGEAIPFFYAEFGPDHSASLLGADLEFNPNSPGTSWIVPFVKEWNVDYPIKFKRDCKWWRRTVDFIRALRRRCDGKLLIAAPTLNGGLDCLAAIRGAKELLIDLITQPEKIKVALEDVCCAYEEILEALSEELNFKKYGSINRHGMYGQGKINVPQCDISSLISPEMFREFEIPCLKREMKALDFVEYHLDGPGAIKHLGSLCQLEDLDVIQWVPGAGEASQQNWMDLYRKIDSLGKGQIFWKSPDEIKYLWKELKSRRLFFVTSVKSKKDAEDLLRWLEKNNRLT